MEGTETNGAATNGADSDKPTGDKPKKPVHRKPLWLAIPTSFQDVDVLDEEEKPTGEKKSVPATYKLVKCASKKEVTKTLNDAGIDVTRTDLLAHIQMWRADPLPLKLSTQVTIKF